MPTSPTIENGKRPRGFSEGVGPKPALIDFLHLQTGESVLPTGFVLAPEPGMTNYKVTARKLQTAVGVNEAVEIGQLTVSDREIEEARVWTAETIGAIMRKSAEGRRDEDFNAYRDQVFGVGAQTRLIEAYVLESVIDFLSRDAVSVSGIALADPGYKVESYGIGYTPDLITLIRSSKDDDGQEKQEVLVITDEKFRDIAVKLRDRKHEVERKVGDTDVLAANIVLIGKEFDDYINDRHASLDE